MKTLGIIPARYGSTRFPGKPLADILGKSMIQRVVDQARKSKQLDEVVVATDDTRIEHHVKAFGGNAIMTSDQHPSGTDRCREVLHHFEKVDVVVNIQGDEPLIPPEQIDTLVQCFQSQDTQIATLVKPIRSEEILRDVNKPKVLINQKQEAIYFSRTPLPHLKDVPQGEWLKHHAYWQHIGIYAYRSQALKTITQLAPSSFEEAESLEQLRWIQSGFKVRVATTEHTSFPVDTPQDLQRVVDYLNQAKPEHGH
ncbi:MAG: 3-deoxy-manno-octulosonate cytidylyltransferase [Salibacteraceae bacterium]